MGVYAGAFLIVYISELTGQRQCVFSMVKSFARPAVFLLWWTLALWRPSTAATCQRPRRIGTPRPALILSHRKHLTSQSAADWPAPLLRPASTMPPRPPPEAARHRFGCPLLLVDSGGCPRQQRHLRIDQSILILVNTIQMLMRWCWCGGTCFAPPARYSAASAGRSVVGASW